MKIRLYVLKRIGKYTAMVKGHIIGLIIVALLALPISFISPKFFQILVDDVMEKSNLDKFWIVVIGLLFVYAIRFISDGLSLYFRNKILNTFTYNIRSDVFSKYKNSPFSFIEKKEIGELKMRIMDDVDALGNFIGEQVVNYLTGILMIAISVWILVGINIKMMLYCLTIIPIVFLVNYLIGIGTKKVNEQIRTVNSEYYTSTHNSLQFWREIKAQNSELTFIERFKNYRNILAKLGLKSIRYWAYTEIFNDFKTNYLTKVLVYIIGAYFVMDEQISVGVLIMFSEYFATLFSSLDSVNAKRVALKVNEPYYKRIFETLDFPTESDGGIEMDEFKNSIKFENVSFGYKSDKPVLKNVSLEIKKGDYLAIVGKTGCGKTTLIKTLLGLYPVEKGLISIDGINIDRINKRCIYENVGIVMQDNYLFDMSIKDNLLIACPQASESDIILACKRANIYDFISKLPNGLDTEIGERGVRLSGGQKQRLSIAAALLKNPEIIIFDEATSSLDKISENIINDAINTLSKTMTVIVITHKPATALRASRVVVMENGTITAVGTHNELSSKNGFYKTLVGEYENEE